MSWFRCIISIVVAIAERLKQMEYFCSKSSKNVFFFLLAANGLKTPNIFIYTLTDFGRTILLKSILTESDKEHSRPVDLSADFVCWPDKTVSVSWCWAFRPTFWAKIKTTWIFSMFAWNVIQCNAKSGQKFRVQRRNCN